MGRSILIPMPEKSNRHGHVCPWWLAYTFDNPLRRFLHDPERIFAGLVRPGHTAVDIGCGMGYFTLALARMVGPDGSVIAVDLQEKMLARAKKRADRKSLSSRIAFHRCGPESIGVGVPADFALAFWVVHEVGDRSAFLREVRAILKPGGHFLVAEPRLHVPASDVRETVELARTAGLVPIGEPAIRWSRAVLFRPRREGEAGRMAA
jgi:ubiquinone/menaquinone biosynthesis C-methylase UbiE